MVVRRNDRRRRLMNDEYVPTIESGSSTERADQHGVAQDASGTRRTYASGADRRNQLRTTDLFPKRTWLIVTFGLLLVSLIAAINGLAWNAESWRSVIGPEGVAALQLGGSGTLASWFTCFLMVSVALVSLQIYAMRRHRCDDYVGTYRMWMWFPPIFVIASLASIVDVSAIARNVFSSTVGMSLPAGSLLPLIVVLVVLAALAGRVLYEVRESRASVAMLVLAWLSLAISVTMQTEWAGNQIAAADRQLVLGNSYLVSSVALLIGHLFYTRFVYLHAHGLIVRKQPNVAKANATSVARKEPARSSGKTVAEPVKAAKAVKPSRAEVAAAKKAAAEQAAADKAAAKKAATNQEAAKKAAKEAAAKEAAAKQAAAKEAAAKEAAAKEAAAKEAAAKQAAAVKKAAVKKSAVKEASPAVAKSKPTTVNSFKSLLDKRKSDQRVAAANEESVTESEPPATLKMSKAERKRAKKAERSARKAA